ncbi:protein SCAF11 isoform X3 [Erythrolamprus reginae]|uniref:protein SCAF11 isoform X3 n=1 Tax=Erythrolamprus reginae TaxID=121349 RepID=UPI00396CEE9E
MKNKKQSVQNADDDKHEAAKGENEENCSCSSDFLSDEDDRCPICLNCLAEQEVGFPENCNHIFCMACILKWAETRASCPVDRKQFKAVCKLNTSEDSVKVQIKQQISKKDNISCNKGKNCPITMKTCKRKQENAGIGFLPFIYKSWNPKYNPSNKEEVTNSVKKNKPRRQTCLNRFFKSNWHDRFSSNSSFTDVSPNYHRESIEISKIDTIIRHKRRELELSCSVLARMARIPSISSEAEIVPYLVLETVFSISTSPLENFDPNFKDQTSQQNDPSQLPVNVLQPQMNLMTSVNTQHQPMSIFPYTIGVPTPIMNIQHNPFNLPPPMPMHLYSGLPVVQVAASSSVSQGLLPPPPPPPPPSQQINFIASQLDGQQLQAAPTTSHVANSVNTTHLSVPSMESIQRSSMGNTASNNIKSSNAAVKLMEKKVNVIVEASADSSKKDQKLLIQEKAAQEVKLAIKPFYQNKDISKEEYKEIVRKAVDKVCHSKSGEVNSAKVANLVKAYVDKYKHSRKKNPDETVSVERK